MKKHHLTLPCLVALIACGSPPPAGGSTPTTASDTTAETKADAATADTATADADTGEVADTSVSDTPPPLDAAADSSDAKVPDSQPLTDASPPTDLGAQDLPPGDLTAPDTAKPDLPKPGDVTEPDATPPEPGLIGIGACTQTAPGWNSCIIQAFWQCIQPTATCVKQKQSELDFSAAWTGGGAMACKIDMGASTAICTGNGPDGKKCLDFVETFDLNAKTATAEVTGPNGKHTMTFQGDAISVKCADGKTESYANDKDLCSPLKGEGCPGKDEPPPGPGPGPDPCPPLAKCKDASMCPPDYVCDGATNLCLMPCPVNTPCPPCTQCDPASGMCSPFAVPPPPP
jgi:hypothetical protein